MAAHAYPSPQEVPNSQVGLAYIAKNVPLCQKRQKGNEAEKDGWRKGVGEETKKLVGPEREAEGRLGRTCF